MRGAGSRRPFGFSFLGQNDVIGACTRALASPRLLPAQGMRRANLLSARAAGYLRRGETTKALADLDLAEAATTGLAGDRFFRRSMGVSIQLLRALAYARTGDMDRAAPLAREAMDARPYSLAVQHVGATILQAARPLGTPSPSPWASVVRLEPDAALKALMSEAEVGNFAGVLAFRSSVTIDSTDKPLQLSSVLTRTPAQSLLMGLIVSFDTSYARAASGDIAGARKDMAEGRARMEAARTVAPGQGTLAGITPDLAAGLEKYVDVRVRQIEARIAVAEKRPADAIRAMLNASLPNDAASVELLTALKGAVATKDAALVPDPAPLRAELAKKRGGPLADVISVALLAPETPRSVVDYERARPNILGALVGGAFSMGTTLLGGIKRTDGFRSTANPDGTTKVEFVGNTPSSALVQEMTLLRAAEIARTAGKPAFVVIDRRDFSRMLTTSQYGVQISSVPTGFKTELTIRLVEGTGESDRKLDAVAVIDALGPYYYEQNAAAGRAGSAK